MCIGQLLGGKGEKECVYTCLTSVIGIRRFNRPLKILDNYERHANTVTIAGYSDFGMADQRCRSSAKNRFLIEHDRSMDLSDCSWCLDLFSVERLTLRCDEFQKGWNTTSLLRSGYIFFSTRLFFPDMKHAKNEIRNVRWAFWKCIIFIIKKQVQCFY